MDAELAKRLNDLNEDFERVSGRTAKNFFCPILQIDEPTDICKGHILPQSTNGNGPWIPQRQDVDNTFGTLCESNLKVVQERDKPAVEFLCDRNLSLATKPKLAINGKEVEHYRTNGIKRVEGHTPLIVEVEGKQIANFNVKVDSTIASTVNSMNFEIRLHRDFTPEVWAAALKAAHLTLFKLLGYQHVFSASGTLLSQLLREIYTQSSRRNAGALQRLFDENEAIIWPIETDRSFESSVLNKRFWVCLQSNGFPFALGVLVVIGKDAFCVFTPCNDGSINTYFSFLKTQPESIAIKEVHFRNDDPTASYWGIGQEPPIRISIPSKS